MRLVGVTALRSHLGLAYPMIAIVAHALGVVFPVNVRAIDYLKPLPLMLLEQKSPLPLDLLYLVLSELLIDQLETLLDLLLFEYVRGCH